MYTTIQTPEQLRENVGLLKRMMGETTRINIIPEQGMTQEQLNQCTHNAAAFDNYLRSKHTNSEGMADYSLANLKSAYVFLRDNGLLVFEVAPVVRKSSNVMTDDRGRIVRNLKREREDAARRDAEEAQQPHRTFEGELKAAETRARVNKTIEETRAQIASFRGSSHSKTYQTREKATQILENAIRTDRTLGGIATAASDIKLLMNQAWD